MATPVTPLPFPLDKGKLPDKYANAFANMGKPAPIDPAAYDLSTDPVLQQIQAYTARVRAEADSQALAQRKRVAIESGDAQYAQDVLGDPLTAAAAAQNPFSTKANLANDYKRGITGLEEDLNKQNLHYSTARFDQLGKAQHDYQSALAAALADEQSRLDQIAQDRLSTYGQADVQDIQGKQDAASRALAYALANPTAPSTTEAPSITAARKEIPGLTGAPGVGTYTPPATVRDTLKTTPIAQIGNALNNTIRPVKPKVPAKMAAVTAARRYF